MEPSNSLQPSNPIAARPAAAPVEADGARHPAAVWGSRIVGLVVILLAAGVFALFVFDISIPWPWKAKSVQADTSSAARLKNVDLVAKTPNTLQVPKDVQESLGILARNEYRVATAKKPEWLRPLVMPGSTALDPGRLYPIRVRFAPCEAFEIAKVPDTNTQPNGFTSQSTPQPEQRELRTGDHVKKGDLLAIVYSVDVGQKKNDLIDALSQLNLDEKILDACDKAGSALPEVFVLQQQRNVEADHNLVARSLNTLKAWSIQKEDIAACYKEADEIIKRRGKRNHDDDDLNKWARVEIRAPEDGVIIERNISAHAVINDNTVNLFQIAKVDQLFVFANVPEDEVPTLKALPTALWKWKVKTVGSAPVEGDFDDIGFLIDPNQHTALVKGHIKNPNEVMRAGQFISATVQLPVPQEMEVVEVPVDAVVEDGQTCVVFVLDKDHPDRFTMRRVQPTHRFDNVVFIRSKPFAKGEERTAEEENLKILPLQPLLPGERVILSGVGELKATLLNLQSQPAETPNDGKDK